MRGAIAVFGCPRVLVGVRRRVAEAEKVRRSRTAGILPFRLGWEPILVTRRQMARLLFSFGHLGAIRLGVKIAQFLDRPIGIAREVAWVFPHCCRIFTLSYLVF